MVKCRRWRNAGADLELGEIHPVRIRAVKGRAIGQHAQTGRNARDVRTVTSAIHRIRVRNRRIGAAPVVSVADKIVSPGHLRGRKCARLDHRGYHVQLYIYRFRLG